MLTLVGDLFRSFRYAFVAVIPVGLVAAWLYAVMYLAGFGLNFVTATIGAISIGVGIDYSIHMTARFREELRRVGDPRAALARAADATGSVRDANDACIMYDARTYREFCRRPNHNPRTKQGQDRGMSCYDWIARVMNDAGKGSWQVPRKTIAGPIDPIAPKFASHL